MRTDRPVTPIRLTLYYYAIEKGLLKKAEDFMKPNIQIQTYWLVNFTELDDDEFLKCLLDANTKLLTHYFLAKSFPIALESTRKLYLEQDKDFRGFRQIMINKRQR